MFEKLKTLLVEWGGSMIFALKAVVGALVGRVLAAFGLTWVSYAYVLPEVKAWVQDYATGLPSTILQLMGALGVDIFMVMILSAVVAKVGMRVFLVGVEALQNMMGNAGG